MLLIWRLPLLICVFGAAGFEQLVLGGWRWNLEKRSLWLQRWSKCLLKAIGFQVEVRGRVPSSGFIAPNHLSYMDIIVLASISQQVFLSKSDVRSWPIVGLFTRMAGTLYIDRNRRSDVANKESDFTAVIDEGLCMTFFLEGTSTNGETILPFRSSLLQPVVANQWPITATYLKYGCVGGDPRTDVCWWGDMGFGGHLLRMLRVRRTCATVVFGKTIQAKGERKELALDLYEEVNALFESEGATAGVSS